MVKACASVHMELGSRLRPLMASGAPNVHRAHRGVHGRMAESCLDRPNIGTDFGPRCGTRVPSVTRPRRATLCRQVLFMSGLLPSVVLQGLDVQGSMESRSLSTLPSPTTR